LQNANFETQQKIKFLLYSLKENDSKINVIVKDETIRLTQKAMSTLFECSTDNIGLHLKNIFESGELDKSSVTEESPATATDGKLYHTEFYTPDAIISVGCRVNTAKATQFRIWATKEFAASVNEFLSFRKFNILDGKGSVSKQRADLKAEVEYDVFNKTQTIVSGFDKMVKILEEKGKVE